MTIVNQNSRTDIHHQVAQQRFQAVVGLAHVVVKRLLFG
jgi:hypothetical protein